MNIGDRVVVVGKHPWSGHRGELLSLDHISALKGALWRVGLDAGVECYAAPTNLIIQTESAVLKRLIEEVRLGKGRIRDSGYNRTHNRHNRS